MFLESLLSKVFLGGSLIVATAGIGVGGVLLLPQSLSSRSFTSSEGSEMKEIQSQKEKSQTISKEDAKHGQCTIYKIIESKGNQTVSEAENNFLELEKQKNTWSYSGIKRACDAAKGGDIFLTEKEVWYWLKYKYVKEWSYSVEKQTVGKELKAKPN